ncbi:MAG TPA: hypothetical protein VGG22_05325 [Candidatus Baltobacteraceae bacterium]
MLATTTLAALILALPVATPSATAAPAAVGPVLVQGKSTYGISFAGATSQSATATQDHAPAGTYFIATPGMLCTGTVTLTGDSRPLPGNPVTSSGPFTFTRTGSPAGCAVRIRSSAGGATATILFQ